MLSKYLIRSLGVALTLSLATHTSHAQKALNFELIDISVQNCLDSWAQGGASVPTVNLCLGAKIKPSIEYKDALTNYGQQNGYTQHVAYSLLKVSSYIAESYIQLMGDGSNLAWNQKLCGYNADVMTLLDFPFNATKPEGAAYVEKIGPRHKQVAEACDDVPAP